MCEDLSLPIGYTGFFFRPGLQAVTQTYVRSPRQTRNWKAENTEKKDRQIKGKENIVEGTQREEVLLGWSEYKYTFIVLHRMNLRFEVSIQEGVFGVPIKNHTFIAINHRFKVLA